MHQKRSARLSPVTRFIGPTIAAFVPVLAVVAIKATGYCYPGCSVWNDSNPEWYVFFCYLCGAQSWVQSIL